MQRVSSAKYFKILLKSLDVSKLDATIDIICKYLKNVSIDTIKFLFSNKEVRKIIYQKFFHSSRFVKKLDKSMDYKFNKLGLEKYKILAKSFKEILLENLDSMPLTTIKSYYNMQTKLKQRKHPFNKLLNDMLADEDLIKYAKTKRVKRILMNLTLTGE